MSIVNPHGVSLDITQLTNNIVISSDYAVTGTGILDDLMETATKHLVAQLESGRIGGESYAVAYVQMYQATLSAALEVWLQKPVLTKEQQEQLEAQTALINAQKELAEAQKEAEAAKKALFLRQIEGFDEDFQHKVMKVQADLWSVAFSVSKDTIQAAGIPAIIQKATMDDLYNKYINKDFDSYVYGRNYLKRDDLIPTIKSNY